MAALGPPDPETDGLAVRRWEVGVAGDSVGGGVAEDLVAEVVEDLADLEEGRSAAAARAVVGDVRHRILWKPS